MSPSFDRRKFLMCVGAAGVAGVSGCLGGNSGSDTNDTANNSGNESSGDSITEGGEATGTTERGNATESSGTTTSSETTANEMEGNESSSSEGGNQSIKVGILQPLTGALASVGQPVRDAALLPAKQLNDSNSAITVETAVEDTQTDPQAAISAAESLVDDNYPAISGPLSSATTVQIAQNVCIPNEVVECTQGTSPEISAIEDNGFVYRTTASDALMSRAISQIATNQVGASSASVLHINNTYGQSLAEAFSADFEGEVLNTVSFESGKSSYTSKLVRAMEGGPDVLFLIAFTANGVQMLRDYYSNYSTDTPILAPEGLRNPELPSNVGRNLGNVVGATSVAAGPSLDFFNSLYQEEYGRQPGQFNAQAYDATALLMLANAASTESTGLSVRDNMDSVANPEGETITAERLPEGIKKVANGEEINYQGVTADITFTESGDIQTGTYRVYRYESGEIQLGDQVTIQE